MSNPPRRKGIVPEGEEEVEGGVSRWSLAFNLGAEAGEMQLGRHGKQ